MRKDDPKRLFSLFPDTTTPYDDPDTDIVDKITAIEKLDEQLKDLLTVLEGYAKQRGEFASDYATFGDGLTALAK